MFKGSLLKRLYVMTSIVLLFPLMIFGYYSAEREKEYNLLVRQDELIQIATHIERMITLKFNEVLAKENALNLSEEEKALILNKHFQPLIDNLATIYPNHGIGIASRDLVRRIALAPGLTKEAIIIPALQNKEFKVFKYGEPDVFQVNSANWDGQRTLVVTYPVYQKGQLVGHTWANIKLQDIDHLYRVSVLRWFLVTILIWLSLMLVIGVFLRRFHSAIECLIAHIAREDDDRKDLEEFPSLYPVLDTVSRLRQDYIGEVNKLKQLLDTCPIAIVVVDKNGIITAYNERFESIVKVNFEFTEKLLGNTLYRMTEVLGVNLKDTVFNRVLKGVRVTHEQKTIGNREWLLGGSPITCSGEITGGIVVLTDITESEMLRKEMLRMDRLSIIGEMAASVAHEIRNPITSVRGYLQFLALKSNNKNMYIDLIDELDRANSVIEDFLSLARTRTVNKELCNLNDLVTSIQPIVYASTVGKGCSLELELESNLQDLLLNQKEIKQLIINLCRNAIDAMEKGQLIIRTKADEDSINLEIEDNGCGIPAEYIEKIKEPFYTTKGNGTGLGLVICQSIVDLHGGSLTIKSIEGIGTIVIVRFPQQQKVLPL